MSTMKWRIEKHKEKEQYKRKKPTKSCIFCRKRKLKCDRQKPLCSSCGSRNITECRYSDDVQFAIKENYSPVNVSKGNPFREYYYLDCKDTGRRILYGPTSVRTFVKRNNWGFMEKYEQLWDKVKIERNKWKQLNPRMLRHELDVFELPLELDSHGVIDEICNVLPTYEQMLQIIETFLSSSNSELYEVNDIFDKEKVLKDFHDSFVPGNVNINFNNERPIIKLIPQGKKNYYKIGVIIMMVILVHYREFVPIPMERLLIFLTGVSTSKVFYIERPQFVLLRCHYRSIYLSGGDDSHLLALSDELTSTARSMGLHLNIRVLYKGQEHVVGRINSLENLWSRILLIDFIVSMRIGKPLNINCSEYYDFDENNCSYQILAQNSNINKFGTNISASNEATANSPGIERLYETDKSFHGKLRRMLNTCRPMLSEFYRKDFIPDLLKNSQILIKFVEEEMFPINNFTDTILIREIPHSEFRLLSVILTLLCINYSLTYVIINKRSLTLRNGSFQTFLISFAFVQTYINRAYEMDNLKFPEMFLDTCKHLPPHLSATLSVGRGLISQSLTYFHAFLYLRITLFENGALLTHEDYVEDWPLDSLRPLNDRILTFRTIFRMYCKIFDGLTRDRRIIFRASSFVILLSLEKVYRTVLEQALESRRRIETSSILNKKNITSLFSSDENGSEFPPTSTLINLLQQQQEHSLSLDHKLNQSSASNLKENIKSVNDIKIDQIASSILDTTIQSHKSEKAIDQMLADEFWTNYNKGWEDLLTTDPSNFFVDL